MYGSNENKNQLTKVQWGGFPEEVQAQFGKRPEVYLSSRELLQAFGTNVVRKIYNNAWVDACLKQIAIDQPELAIITDGRFPNEIQGVHDVGGLTLRLTRNPLESKHDSEVALDSENFDWNEFSVILDNAKLTRGEQNKEVFKILYEWGWVDFEMADYVSPKEEKERARHIKDGVMKIKV